MCFIKLVRDLTEFQMARGAHVLIENPVDSDAWDMQHLQFVARMKEIIEPQAGCKAAMQQLLHAGRERGGPEQPGRGGRSGAHGVGDLRWQPPGSPAGGPLVQVHVRHMPPFGFAACFR